MSGELGDYVNKQQAEQAAVAAEQAAAALRTMPLIKYIQNKMSMF